MYVCMNVCMYVRTYVCMYICMYVYMTELCNTIYNTGEWPQDFTEVTMIALMYVCTMYIFLCMYI